LQKVNTPFTIALTVASFFRGVEPLKMSTI